MAHADYDCCAVCDTKIHYVGVDDATTKEDLCKSCAAELHKRGTGVYDVESLMAWMKSAPPADVIRILDECGFRECFYSNEVDDLYAALKASVAPEGGKEK